MTNDEINRYIHVEIMGKCWHDLVLGRDDVWRCNEIDCKLEVQNFGGMHGDPKGNPDYTSDDSRRRLLNEVVAKVLKSYGTDGYVKQLKSWVGNSDYILFQVDAKQIAGACVRVWQESKSLSASAPQTSPVTLRSTDGQTGSESEETI